MTFTNKKYVSLEIRNHTNETYFSFYVTNLSAEILEGQAYDFNSHILNQTGIYYDTLSTNKGCDSVFILDLVVHPNVQTQINASICQGETYSENGFSVSETGTYQQNLQTIHGADSVVVLNLIVKKDKE